MWSCIVFFYQEAQSNKDRREVTVVKIPEPEIDDSKVTLSWCKYKGFIQLFVTGK